ncbi:MAG: CBS domain-containing protein [Candidatus Aenigmarchaeota archaeon]|nr:CBS domain-containing protein [Candidatus Aenigmarchaeota archaeon]
MAVLVKDVMSSPVLTIGIGKTARDAGKLMRKHRKGFLVVVKNGNPAGVISESDLITEIVCKSIKADKVKLADLMHEPIIAVDKEDDILSATRKMKQNNVHRLTVLSEGRLAGVVSLTDIAKTSPEMLDLLEYRLKMKEKPFTLKERITIGLCDSCDNYSEDLRNVEDQWICDDCREEKEL